LFDTVERTMLTTPLDVLAVLFLSLLPQYIHIHRMKTKAGEEILYVGDHLYSDVLRSKRTLGWRTALIVPEMIHEMKVFHENRDTYQHINDLRQLRDDISSHADTLRKELTLSSDSPGQHHVLEQEIAQLQEDDVQIKQVLIGLTESYHQAFHPVWGQMFVAGYQDSRLAFYVENYACLYTARASNLGLKASPERSFRTKAEMLPHDKMLADARAVLLED
jgi:5'-nucleotidase